MCDKKKNVKVVSYISAIDIIPDILGKLEDCKDNPCPPCPECPDCPACPECTTCEDYPITFGESFIIASTPNRTNVTSNIYSVGANFYRGNLGGGQDALIVIPDINSICGNIVKATLDGGGLSVPMNASTFSVYFANVPTNSKFTLNITIECASVNKTYSLDLFTFISST